VTNRLAADRAQHLRVAAEIALRIVPQATTVHVKPQDLADALDDRKDLIVENVRLKAEHKELLDDIAVLHRQVAEHQQAVDDQRATMIATPRRRS
jgi:hypothetical protein